jgi:osmotically inducible lipoprotein OsmB
MNQKMLTLVAGIFLIGTIGCTTLQRNVAVGTGVGAVGGAVVGSAVGSPVAGAVVGGAVGAGAGYVLTPEDER